MMEAELVGVKAETMDRVVAIAVLDVTTDGVVHIGGMNANLVLATCLELELHEGVVVAAPEGGEMGYGKFAAIIYGRGVGEVGFVVLKPRGYGAVVLLHDSAEECYVAAVIDYVVPIVLENLLCLHVFGIDHESTCFAVETVDNMCAAVLATLYEVVVEYGFDIQRLVSGSH